MGFCREQELAEASSLVSRQQEHLCPAHVQPFSHPGSGHKAAHPFFMPSCHLSCERNRPEHTFPTLQMSLRALMGPLKVQLSPAVYPADV